jgi:hypothetical protein
VAISDPHLEHNAQPFSRRRLLRIAGGVDLAAVPALSLANEASAGRSWCRWDPVLKIDGQVVDLRIGSPTDMNDAATGPTIIDVQVPSGSRAYVIATDQGFGRNGYDIDIRTSDRLSRSYRSTEVKISVFQPSDIDLPVTVYFSPRSTGRLSEASDRSGRSNEWIVLNAR